MFKNKFHKIILIVLMLVVMGNLMMVQGAEAQGGELWGKIKGNLNRTGGLSHLPAYTDPLDVVALVIKGILSLIALIFFILVIMAGIKWMTAEGNAERIEQAKQTLRNSIIGLAIVLFAYAITFFVFNILLNPNGTT